MRRADARVLHRPALALVGLLTWSGCSGRPEPRPRSDAGAASTPSPAPTPEPPARRSSVRTKRWTPAAASAPRAPVVLLLHGAGGAGLFLEHRDYRRYPEALAAAGLEVVMPYYQEAHDTPVRTARVVLDELGEARVGVIGFSRGGFIGGCLAGTDPRVSVFVSLYGGVDEGCRPEMRRMPPTLVLHGRADPLVPVESAETLARLVRARGALAATKLYPGQEHAFVGGALDDSIRLSTEFVVRHLVGPQRP